MGTRRWKAFGAVTRERLTASSHDIFCLHKVCDCAVGALGNAPSWAREDRSKQQIDDNACMAADGLHDFVGTFARIVLSGSRGPICFVVKEECDAWLF